MEPHPPAATTLDEKIRHAQVVFFAEASRLIDAADRARTQRDRLLSLLRNADEDGRPATRKAGRA